ncbi:MAG: hypothetical protein K1X65_22280 [Caldilineales bacterium]|nr:hypothetical protein [Caldilineales bacterium]MCW5858430.1 hypothetical protein [Caldilineales bacterium]
MSKFTFGFWVGLAAGLMLAALLGQKPTWDIDLPREIDPARIPAPGFPVERIQK